MTQAEESTSALPIPSAAIPARGDAAWRTVLGSIIVAAGNLQRRLLAMSIGVLGPRRAYALMAFLARRFYQLADAVRAESESRCRAALGGERSESEIQAIARQAFIHRVWNLVDLSLAPRLLRPKSYARFGGRLAEAHLDLLIDAQRRGRPIILLTAYYGPYDLLPVFLGLNGIQATAVYRPHPNRDFDRFRQSVRSGTGCRMLPHTGAGSTLSDLLERGQTIALLADHAGTRGVPLSFLGLRTTVPRTVGLLAERYAAIVTVTVIRRLAEPFQFELIVADLFAPDAWQNEPDPIAYITKRYTAALEQAIREAPEQYLWLHRRGTESEQVVGTLVGGYASVEEPEAVGGPPGNQGVRYA